MNCQTVVVWPERVFWEAHRQQVLICGKHPHHVAIDNSPSISGGDGSDWSIHTSAGSGVAVVAHHESIAVGCPTVRYPFNGRRRSAWLDDR